MSFDAIIIGGGIAGISAGAELARDMSVCVLEAEDQLAYHSTGRSAAIFIRNYGNTVLRQLNALAHPTLAGETSDDNVLSPRGELLLALDHQLDALEDYLAGTETIERLSPEQALELVPVLRRDRIAAAVFEQDAQDIDVDRLLQSYARALRARGGEIRTGQRVTGLARENGLWQVATHDATLAAPIIVNAAGAWADELAGLAGIPGVGLQPMRRSAVIMDVPEATGPVDRWPLFGAMIEDADGWYAKPEAGRLMISPADEDPVPPGDAWPDDMVLAEGLYRFEQMVDIPVIRPSHSWAGLRSFVPDRTPVLGLDPASEGFFWLAGQGGYGVQTAPAMAALARAALTSGIADAGLATALSPARFR
ncbi:NAD(P)/FAD-dependent oxidoreductase [Roseovarius sp. C7]|uniref:NAD(P)/FAD-dependent oxidoreductase n=1 Tax=Roseovarius sp. C7 TaxID=3398643 RepID=UPI0039F56A60